jgi:hypothetical protein
MSFARVAFICLILHSGLPSKLSRACRSLPSTCQAYMICVCIHMIHAVTCHTHPARCLPSHLPHDTSPSLAPYWCCEVKHRITGAHALSSTAGAQQHQQSPASPPAPAPLSTASTRPSTARGPPLLLNGKSAASPAATARGQRLQTAVSRSSRTPTTRPASFRRASSVERVSQTWQQPTSHPCMGEDIRDLIGHTSLGWVTLVMMAMSMLPLRRTARPSGWTQEWR